MNQLSLSPANLEFQACSKRTRKLVFLEEMNRVVQHTHRGGGALELGYLYAYEQSHKNSFKLLYCHYECKQTTRLH